MNIFSDIKDYVMSQKCKVHPNYPCDKIYLNENAKERRICDKCFQQNKYQVEEILNIRDLLDIDETTILETYPPLRDHSLLPQLISQKEELVQAEIDSFFDEMLKEFQIAIEKKKKEVKEKRIKTNEMQFKIIEKYNEIAQIDQLRKALFTKQAGSEGELEKVIRQSLLNADSNTQKIKQLINDLFNNTGCLRLEESRKEIKQISETINNLQIFRGFESMDLLPTASLVKTTLGDTQQTLVAKNDLNHLVFANETESRKQANAFLGFILEPSANYIIQIELEQQQYYNKLFLFGIVSDLNKDNPKAANQRLCYYDKDNNFGVNKLIKGPPIVSQNNYERKSLECRINLERKEFRVGTLPNYESVVEVENPNLIDSAGSYRFFLAGLNAKSKMTILKLLKVNSFDDLM